MCASLPIITPTPHTHSYRLVLVSGLSTGTPAHYLDSEERVLSLKTEAPPTGMFVLCVNTPGDGLLELIDSVRQNVCENNTQFYYKCP